MATIVANPVFEPEHAADDLMKAMKGLGTNEALIIEVIAKHNNEQRQKMKIAFQEKFKKDLDKELGKELSLDFKKLTEALMMPPRVYDAHEVRTALKGIGTKENVLIEVLLTRTHPEMKGLKEAYQQKYSRELGEDIQKDTKGTFQRLLLSEITLGRPIGDEVDGPQAVKDAKAIMAAGQGQLGTDESVFSAILTTRSFAQLRLVFKAYYELTTDDIEKAICREAMGHVQDAWLTLVGVAKGMSDYYAEKIHKSLKGFGTDDSALIRIIAGRSEVDLQSIKMVYGHKFGRPLVEMVRSNTKGDYRKLLTAILEGNKN